MERNYFSSQAIRPVKDARRQNSFWQNVKANKFSYIFQFYIRLVCRNPE